MTKFIISVNELDASFVTMTELERRIERSRCEAVFLRCGMHVSQFQFADRHHVECSSVEIEGFKRGYVSGVIGQYDMGGMTDADAMFWDKDEKPAFLAKGDMDTCCFPEDPNLWLKNEKPTASQAYALIYALDNSDRQPTNGVVPMDELDLAAAGEEYPFDSAMDDAAEWLEKRAIKHSAQDLYVLEQDGGVSVHAADYL